MIIKFDLNYTMHKYVKLKKQIRYQYVNGNKNTDNQSINTQTQFTKKAFQG